ncbi:MAG: CocE/NonD family hydrolase [Acidobacteria bacterium]|nr:CocE/NonD family hydrolase [Acidobacteriota bacterium]MCI0722014.1 CocE/NonD family hydrolase [Acidobacteriota bacterium]
MSPTKVFDLYKSAWRPLLVAWGLILFAFGNLAWSKVIPGMSKETVLVEMRDGIKLATDVYTLAPGKGQPVLLMRTPYNKGSGQKTAELYARSGYTVVVQDCRGRYASGGSFVPYNTEGQDGFDTLEWITKQPWSNGGSPPLTPNRESLFLRESTFPAH